MSRKVLSGIGFVLGIAGFLAFIAIGVGTWIAKREADRQLTAAVEKAHHAGNVASNVISLVREIIARAKASLVAARVESVQTPGEEPDFFTRMVVRKAKRDLPGEVDKARDAVGVASEAVVVAGAVLDVFDDRKPDEVALGVKEHDLKAARSQLDSAAAELKNARSVLGFPIPGASEEQLTQVDQALATATDVTNQVDRAVTEARGKVDELKRKSEVWSMRAAIGITGLTALAALGQVFLVRACWRGLQRNVSV